MKAIQTKNIGLDLGRFQLQSVSTAFPAEKITAIIGPNGSGKSTLLKIISRLLAADAGEVFIDDMNVKMFRTKEFAKTLTMLPQSKELLLQLTVRELVSYGRSPHQKRFGYKMAAADEEIVNWALEITGTVKHADRMYHTLSGGEQQKARIAMSLAQKTDILLLDEPTTFLDIAHQFDVLEILREINQQYRVTIVMVLHDLQQAVKYSDYLVAMKKGNIAAAGVPEDVLTSAFLKNVYDIDAKVKYEDGYPLIIPAIGNVAKDGTGG
ncbi:iron complex transport system ATP-binding protein [Evansella caseinilytica]|uniref:Iron complex transport system ATP-binding protein n=1 Tax=Evansella caseinilytica TaxID=1503961 RepID=A0A1H3RE02_9BACI|nr:ABC transporter ATP-binding protein [Evansella caseinilytica]SDZ23964.1 iron complex transport system ATP-binding protein [Evansella caseinilytica]